MGTETPREINGDAELSPGSKKYAVGAAVFCGMAKTPEDAPAPQPGLSHAGFVAPPGRTTRTSTTSETVRAEDMDMAFAPDVRQVVHKAYAGTGICCTGPP